jgi:cytidyltransferase-like protein
MITTFKKLGELAKLKTVYTAGSFDLFHRGHVLFLSSVKERFPGYKLVVGVLPDKRIQAKKGKERPVIKQADRLAVVDASKFVDFAFIAPVYKDGRDATFVILEKLRPKYVAVPYKKYLTMQDEFRKSESEFVLQESIKGTESTSQIIRRIKAEK